MSASTTSFTYIGGTLKMVGTPGGAFLTSFFANLSATLFFSETYVWALLH